MYTKLEMMAMMAEDVNAPELALYAAREDRKNGWLKRLFVRK